MKNEYEFTTVILAALLHDIGKFWQRTGQSLNQEDERIMPNCCPVFNGRYSHQHVLYSGRFIREFFENKFPLAENIVLYHHRSETAQEEYRRLAKIISLSDWLSSGERRDREETGKGIPSAEPLISIFSTLSIDNKTVPEKYIPLLPLSIDLNQLFPKVNKQDALSQNQNDANSYSKFWEAFTKDMTTLSKSPLSDLLIERLRYLLFKYTISIPSAAYVDKPDLTLYHHLKSTAAIASCLWNLQINENEIDIIMGAIKQNDEKKLESQACLFLSGDISGIQDFIYSVTSTEALKGLKGRSLYLQLLSESVAQSIIKQLGLTDCNIIYIGGGNFHLLLPNSELVKQDLSKIKNIINNNLLKAHRGNLTFNIAYTPVKYKDFLGANFGEIWEKVKALLTREKRRKYSLLFDEANKSTEILGPFDEGGKKAICSICGEELEQETEKCLPCSSFTDLSYDLTRARIIYQKNNPPKAIEYRATSWNELLESIGSHYEFLPETAERDNSYLLNSTEFLNAQQPYHGFRFIAKNTPMDGSNVKTLDSIAKSSKGIKRWAVLRADVDDMSKIFTEGLGKKDRTISRMSMLSELLSLFFNTHVESVARENEFKDNIYVIYSGGDDLFIIGAWSVIPDFAMRLYEDFRKFTAQNLTFSAAVHLVPSVNFPVYQAAENAGQDLKLAKKNGKNKIVLFGMEIPWNVMKEIHDVAVNKIAMLLDKKVPRSLLKILYSGWAEGLLVKEGRIPMTRIWRFLYAMCRLKERHRDYADKITDLEKIVMTDNKLKQNLNISIRWAELLTREGG